MIYKEDHAEAKSLTVKILIGSQLLNFTLMSFATFAMSLNLSVDLAYDYISQISYLYATATYILTYHQFIFIASSIQTRFQLLNLNLA
jgi:hypothetical protein